MQGREQSLIRIEGTQQSAKDIQFLAILETAIAGADPDDLRAQIQANALRQLAEEMGGHHG